MPSHLTQDHSPAIPVVDTSHSPYARLRPVSLSAVTLTDDFWSPRRHTNRTITLQTQYQQLEDTGRMFNFRRAAGTEQGPFRGTYFNDSDAYKWLEGVAWSLATNPDPDVDALADQVIATIGAAQQPDGYLNTYFMFEHVNERWTNYDLHEMYCAGHLFQAAVAHHRATGKTNLLDIAIRFADHICATFGPEEQGKRFWNDGHPEVELAMVELFRTTGNRRYLEQVQYFIDARGYKRLGRPYGRYGPSYSQDHLPFRDLQRVEGHAVRALYLNSGAADVYAETGEASIQTALERMWDSLTTRQLYVTGGAGSRYEGEAMGKDYELPNERAYTETCASVAVLMWAWRMLATTGDARYTDVLETALYNGILSGVSLEGDTYFYQNPLMDDGTHRRQAWFGTACCPPNIIRLLASLPGYVYSTSEAAIWTHLYIEGEARIDLDGTPVVLTQHTDYPWDGTIALDVQGTGTWTLHLRIPAWCTNGTTVLVNGERQSIPIVPGSYAAIERTWNTGDRVELTLPMTVRQLVSHPHVLENAQRAAVARGPLIYCVEGVDNPGVDLRDVVVQADAQWTTSKHAEVLGGIVVLEADAELHSPSPQWTNRLYLNIADAPTVPNVVPLHIVAIPYYAWANREPGRMQVWLQSS